MTLSRYELKIITRPGIISVTRSTLPSSAMPGRGKLKCSSTAPWRAIILGWHVLCLLSFSSCRLNCRTCLIDDHFNLHTLEGASNICARCEAEGRGAEWVGWGATSRKTWLPCNLLIALSVSFPAMRACAESAPYSSSIFLTSDKICPYNIIQNEVEIASSGLHIIRL